MENRRYLSVTALNRYISYKFETDAHLQQIYLEGELSNFKKSGRNYYFSIKDDQSEISGMIFYPTTFDFTPTDGMKVRVVGKIQIYEKRGTYGIIVSEIKQAGLGNLYQQFLDLKKKLELEGLFSEERKLVVPEFIKHLVIVTSKTGEAINDILSTINHRLPLMKITLYPTLVQGNDAPKDMIRALRQIYSEISLGVDYDCIIIGRGGGSFEDLSCFNDEMLARTLFQSPIATISAVGHEGDYTICDFVASRRAPTPTGAAVFVSKDKPSMVKLIDDFDQRMKSSFVSSWQRITNLYNQLTKSYGLSKFSTILDNKAKDFNSLMKRLGLSSPELYYEKSLANLRNNTNQLTKSWGHYLQGKYQSFEKLSDRLVRVQLEIRFDEYGGKIAHFHHVQLRSVNALIDRNELVLNALIKQNINLNPLNLMTKGYSIVYQNETIMSNSRVIDLSKNIEIRFQDGLLEAKPIQKLSKGELK